MACWYDPDDEPTKTDRFIDVVGCMFLVGFFTTGLFLLIHNI